MLRLLCTGDLHLGRHPSRVPERDDDLSVEGIWDEIVDCAVTQGVDALVLTGDVVDRENRFYESIGPLQRGLDRLGAAGVDVVAVAGNHDWDVLPDVVDSTESDRFHLLGRGGEWTGITLRRDGEVVGGFVGWSYPAADQRTSPVEPAAIRAAVREPNVPVLGVLHADLDRPGSRNAPVDSAELAGTAVDGWLLGHIHAPALDRTTGTALLYPGSPQPLDPTETGPHGPWMVDVRADGRIEAEMIPLATLRYARRAVDAGAIDGESDFRRTVQREIRDGIESFDRGEDRLRRAVFRLRCTGRTDLGRELERFARHATDELRVEHDEITGVVDDFLFDLDPSVDLDRLLEGRDPPSELARMLVAIRDGDDNSELEKLVEAVADGLDDIHAANAYAPLAGDPETSGRPGEDELRSMLYRQGLRLLDELLAQGRTERRGSEDG